MAEETKNTATVTRAPARRRGGSKRFREALKKANPSKRFTLEEAVQMLKAFPGTKFDETVDLAVRIGIDPKKSDQMVRGAVSLPKGLGKSKKVIAFAEGPEADAAKAAGADAVGSADLAKKIQDGWMDFDVAVAAPDMMKHVGRLGKVLGPQGKMPSPKSGTVTKDIGTAVKEFKAGKVEFRNDAAANVHVPVGKKSFSQEDLVANAKAFLDHLLNQRPAKAKGQFMTAITLSATMSPGVKVNTDPWMTV